MFGREAINAAPNVAMLQHLRVYDWVVQAGLLALWHLP
jgi:hypothetical protein